MSLWLALAKLAHHPESAPGGLETLQALLGELDGRCSEAGLGSVAGVLEAHRRLAHVLDALDPQRLDALSRTIGALQDELTAGAGAMARLLELKRRLAGV